MASISKPAGQKNWVIQFYFEGRKYRKSLRVANKRDAMELKRLIERQLAEGMFDPESMLAKPKKISRLSQLIDLWSAYLGRRSDLKARTRKDYIDAANQLLEIVGDIQLRQFDSRLVKNEIFLSLQDRYTSIASVKNRMANMSVMFGFAEEESLVTRNPFHKNLPNYRRKKPVFYKASEIDVFLNYWTAAERPLWARVYFVTMLNTGNRRMEHFNLRWSENIFLDEKIIKFAGKGRYEGKERIVPLNDSAIDAFRMADRKLGEDRVFFQANTIEAVSSAWQRFKNATGWTHRLHSTRSNRASHLVMAGYRVEKVMEIMGWEDYTTYKIYAGISKEFIGEDRNLVNW